MRFIDVLYFLSRLYSKGRVLGHKRGKRNSRPNTSLIQIEGVATKEDAQFYLGKVRSRCTVWIYNPHGLYYQRVAYVYRAKKEVHGTKVRVIWGYVSCYSTRVVAPFINL